jgi:hypothetical protein
MLYSTPLSYQKWVCCIPHHFAARNWQVVHHST